MNIDTVIKETRQKLIDTINQSGLPLEVTRLILLELQMMVGRQIDAVMAIPNKEDENGTDTHSN